MTVDFKFTLKQCVKILPLEKLVGVIKSIWITSVGLQYEVRYFCDGKANEIYFFEDELEVV